jgi:hypothetical protein
MFKLSVTLLILLAVGSGVALAGVEYPAFGNVQVEEGTIEIWFTPMTNMYPTNVKKFYTAFSLFAMDAPGSFRMNGYWFSQRQKKGEKQVNHGVRISMDSQNNPKALRPISSKAPKDWKPREPHHFAFTWSGKTMKMWCDGKLLVTRVQIEPLSGDLGDAKLILGSKKRRKNKIIFHAIRVSSVARSEKELQEPKPEADQSTLLLDIFDTAEKVAKAQSTVEVMFNQDETAPKTAPIRGAHFFADEPKPGLAQYKKSKPKKEKE